MANILNSKPIAIRASPEGSYLSISPNDILLGRASTDKTQEDWKEEQQPDESILATWTLQQQVVQAWWAHWTTHYWPQLVPRTKWQKTHRSLQVGHVCHLQYKSKFSPPKYRLCRVTAILPNEDGVVRTVEVSMRPRHKADLHKTYISKDPNVIKTGVQRLAVLLPVEEQGEATQDLSELDLEVEASDQEAPPSSGPKTQTSDPKLAATSSESQPAATFTSQAPSPHQLWSKGKKQ